MKEAKLEAMSKIKEGLEKLDLDELEKSSSVKIVEEWFKEDKGLEELYTDLSALSETIKEYLAELGIV
ncbi:MAG TPA: hypothetical protein ENK87_01555 [Nitratifractor sp.]|jgi:hypothetical protein|nr:hypothetical protein [Nitratifractor sp.]HHH20589.1 hypothetical protein [Nitratifractor sp.]